MNELTREQVTVLLVSGKKLTDDDVDSLSCTDAAQRARAEIARYDLVEVTRCGEGWQEMQRDDRYGDWVQYEDHMAAMADERRRALEEVTARIIDTHRMGDRDAWLDLARLIRAKAHAGQEG